MKQQEALNILLPVLKEDDAVRAIFLKGSIARGEDDKYSDVDLYCLVKKDKLNDFLNKRLEYLKKYKATVFWTEVNFVAPQIVVVYNNGLHLDLYTVTEETLKQSDEILVLYDPENLLSDYENRGFEYSKKEIINIFNDFTFGLLEFEVAFKRGNMVWATRLACHLSGYLAYLIRYIYDPMRARLGFKRMQNYIPEKLYLQFNNALDKINPSNHLQGVIKLLDILDQLIGGLSKKVDGELNLEFYNFMAKKIKN